MNEPVVLVEAVDPMISMITLNRPEKRNALSLELINSLCAAVAAAADDRQCRVVILRGAGPAFCAGLDLNEAATGDPAVSAAALKSLYESICLSPLVTIAAAHGPAMGGGAGLIAACDLAIAADNLQLAYPEVRRGLVAALVTCLVRRQVSDRVARELILLGQTIRGQDALAMGLVNRVVAAKNLMSVTTTVATEICLGAPCAIARSKQLLDTLSPRPIAEELQAALQFHLDARHSAEAAEGITAFKEKRPPNWPPKLKI